MKKIITCILLGVACLMPNNFKKDMPDIVNAINSPTTIEISVDNNLTNINSESDMYDAILDELNDMLEGSHEMPAFGVSLDNETKEARKKGVWIEFKYSSTITHNEMPFDSLLIEVQKDWTGFNIYRGNNGVFEGRCFYISLEKTTMDSLYDLIVSYAQN